MYILLLLKIVAIHNSHILQWYSLDVKVTNVGELSWILSSVIVRDNAVKFVVRFYSDSANIWRVDTYRPEPTLFKQWLHSPIQTHTRRHCTSNFEFWADAKSRHRHDIFTNIRLSANLIAKVCCRPGIKIAMSFREASVTDEKIAIDFVASAHDAGCHEGYQQVTFSSNLTA